VQVDTAIMIKSPTLRRWLVEPVAFAIACLMPVGLSSAAPTLTVSPPVTNLVSGNLEWPVLVTPDAALFTMPDLVLGGSVAIELALEVHGSDLLSASVSLADWPIETAGNNPFTGTATTGVSLDLVNDTVFVSVLSNFLTSGTPVQVLTLETAGTDCTTVSWGGHTVLGDTPSEYQSSLLAQAGMNFTGIAGTLTEPDEDGDFDTDCDVDGADFLEWQQNLGSPYTAMDLADWETNLGTVAPLSANTAAVPEPSPSLLLFLAALLCRYRH